MGALTFGHETHHRTMPLLLSQPVARRTIWREKMLVLAVGLVIASATAWLCLQGFCSTNWQTAAMTATVAVIALCAFCGAPTLTLLGHNAIAGAVCAICFPGAIALVDSIVIERWFRNDRVPGLCICGCSLLLYCVPAAWIGYAKFQGLQALDGASRELALPTAVETILARPFAGISTRLNGPFVSLIKKELRLQKPTFLLTGFFCLLALGGALLFIESKDVGAGVLAADFAIYILLIPLIAGGLSVAEERAWGIADWHLTLPPSSKRQWLAKMLVTLPVSLVLGLVLPAGLYWAGALFFAPKEERMFLQIVLAIALVQLCVTSLAIYAATFSNSTTKAILASLALIVALCTALMLLKPVLITIALMLVPMLPAAWRPGSDYPTIPDWYEHQQMLALGIRAVALVVLACFFQWFAFSNYRQVGTSVRKYACQGAILLIIAALCVCLVNAIDLWPGWSLPQSPPFHL